MHTNGYTQISSILEGKCTGQSVRIRGWVYRKRESGSVLFILIRDSTGVVQTVVGKENVSEIDFENAKKALIESSIVAEGFVTEDKRAPGGFEIHLNKFEMIGSAEPFPITEYQSEEFLLDKRHLWLRSQKLVAVLKIKNCMLRAAREWFEQNDFIEVTPPIITANACEGGSTLFKFDYFGTEAYLSQSAQLYLEALIYSLEKVWSLTPSFRAEKSRTTRHLTEYWHLEEEAAWVGNDENMKIQEELVTYICHYIADNSKKELHILGRTPSDLYAIKTPFEKISYENAIKLLQARGFEIEWGADFGAKEERALTIDKNQPLFIVNYPKELKAFYMKENPDDRRTYLCADLLAPEGYGEIIGGSERETDVEKLIERLQAEDVLIKNYDWYLDLRKFGSVQHSGFGLGVERFLKWICKLEHIRDATPFPRTITRLLP
jgi:asparaginyl-tRNA synthetase